MNYSHPESVGTTPGLPFSERKNRVWLQTTTWHLDRFQRFVQSSSSTSSSISSTASFDGVAISSVDFSATPPPPLLAVAAAGADDGLAAAAVVVVVVVGAAAFAGGVGVGA